MLSIEIIIFLEAENFFRFFLHDIFQNFTGGVHRKFFNENKVVNGFFTIDRNYITKRTTLSSVEQKEIDQELKICTILNIGEDKDSVNIDYSKLTTMLMDKNESILKGFVKEVKAQKKQSKAEIIRQQLKKNIYTQNDELYNAYCEWIDSVSNKRGYMDKKAVIEGQQVIDNFCSKDLDKALKVISIATINSYIDMNWAVNAYRKDYKVSINMPTLQNIQQLSNEVF